MCSRTLTDIRLSDLGSLRSALRKLHVDYHVPNVVISSIPLSRIVGCFPKYLLPDKTYGEIANDSLIDEDKLPTSFNPQSYLVCIVSSATSGPTSSSSLSAVYARCVPLLPGYFTGVGDLFSALVLGHLPRAASDLSCTKGAECSIKQRHSNFLADATAHALSKTHTIVSLTHDAASADSLPQTDDELDAQQPQRKSRRMKGRELRLVQGRDVFRSQEPVEALMRWEEFWEE